MFKTSKERVDDAVARGTPVLERIRHIIPIFGEKQIVNMSPPGNGRTTPISIEDVMLHARMLSGGLGDGGFFRVSAQAAERARILRNALDAFFDDLIELHTLHRYGFVFDRQDKPWNINFYGSISALESERARTKLDAMNAGSAVLSTILQLKQTGAGPEIIRVFLSKRMLVDEDAAKLYAEI
jgi:hypothetical protein